MQKRIQLDTAPCRTPLETENLSEYLPFHKTSHDVDNTCSYVKDYGEPSAQMMNFILLNNYVACELCAQPIKYSQSKYAST